MVYAKPGDVLDVDVPILFQMDTKKQININNELFPNAYSNGRIQWWRDSRAFTFEYNQRGHQVYRIIEVDANTGTPRAIVNEECKTFFEYSGKRYRYDINDGREIIWMSERDGWNHLYLYDGLTGRVKNQITKGEWTVRGVDRVDVKNRQISFRASGMYPGKDPYFINYYRINFDGTGLIAYTEGDGNHSISFSPDSAYYVDTYSRVDMPPVWDLRRGSDRKLVVELERADIQDLLKIGWKMPEVFVSKGRDGVTDIWGIINRPMKLDETKKIPILENIYAGPQGSFVPKTFSSNNGMQPLCELGFIVVQIDGMGTSNRSKAFHDVCWKDLGDAGFPDRILWMKSAAERYPYIDITRVGVYGTSAGGQNAAGAVLFHPEFYKVAVAACGCHDNRMDKIWWNELWMGWPIGPEYAASSNVDNAYRLQGKLFLIVGEMDSNVDPSSTMQVVNALIKANKDFDLLVVPGMNHSNGGTYGERKRRDFFVKNLLDVKPPEWNNIIK
jgi:dipeptidyl aminopeptidase/acylaminoacyl peptidase